MKNILKKFFPLFTLAALLPLLLLGIADTDTVYQLIRPAPAADTSLRIWLEPASVVLAPGETISLQIMGNFERDDLQVHTVNITIPSASGLRITPSIIRYVPPFRGIANLGEIQVTAVAPGSFTLDIPPENITTSISELDIITSPAQIEVTQ